ncbi:helix-turn-helix domain-containing protein [Pseudomonas panipatensis]|uniref:Putative transcriptional regulator n=1 Tax=Pseudomonas panipatensis TaxID=428992 RepID=A0A1G8EPJ2_9PSED|nr:transcriptional regulator [Pseudomonas panipatensis]SDH71806.1 putative transcriptional regulator [Pseudomonas panipatensis]SMP68677.1 putative transcriptional regulator [Pseudomonas panipatensis]
MTKRDIFAELLEGFDDLAAQRQGKRTLREHPAELPPLVPASAEEIVAVRKKLNMSQPVFARVLHTKPATLKNWEQSRSTPNDQATVLIRLLDKHPETLQLLAELA